jgi:hypothetical protein
MTSPQTPPPGWYPDPEGGVGQRYWDGAIWTEHRTGQPPATAVQPVYAQRPVYPPAPGNGMAVAALVCGIVGAVFGLIPLTFFIALALGLVAVVLGPIAWNRANKVPAAGKKGLAIAGTILGVVALGVGIVGAVIVDDTVDEIDRELDDASEELDRELDQLDEELEQDLDEFDQGEGFGTQ